MEYKLRYFIFLNLSTKADLSAWVNIQLELKKKFFIHQIWVAIYRFDPLFIDFFQVGRSAYDEIDETHR